MKLARDCHKRRDASHPRLDRAGASGAGCTGTFDQARLTSPIARMT
jgi:hypothetical protein